MTELPCWTISLDWMAIALAPCCMSATPPAPPLLHTAALCPSWVFSTTIIVLKYHVLGPTLCWSLHMGHTHGGCVAGSHRDGLSRLCLAQQPGCHRTAVTQPCGTGDAPHFRWGFRGRFAPRPWGAGWGWLVSCFPLLPFPLITQQARCGA